jgi:hypothetical protein
MVMGTNLWLWEQKIYGFGNKKHMVVETKIYCCGNKTNICGNKRHMVVETKNIWL